MKSDIVICTPEFTDKTSSRVSTAVELFNEGLFTLGECLTLLAPVYPSIDFKGKGYDENLFNSRFYHGQLLGSKVESNDENKLDSVIEGINNVLAEDGKNLLDT